MLVYQRVIVTESPQKIQGRPSLLDGGKALFSYPDHLHWSRDWDDFGHNSHVP